MDKEVDMLRHCFFKLNDENVVDASNQRLQIFPLTTTLKKLSEGALSFENNRAHELLTCT
jgi:hypothetical protein